MFGFLNVYKPTKMTSHDVVAVLRKITRIKQIGHTGTLDPFAQGVLPICIGKATRLIEYLDDEKEYLAEIAFGKSTDTYDCDGATVNESNLKTSLKDIQDGLKVFEGEILQTPPIYSALKVNGKRLYEYARKGEDIKIEPRKVFIEKIELKDFNEENQKAHVLIKCSKGTYIRSIAHDLGQNLGTGAYLSNLTRTQAGKFFVNQAIALDSIKTMQDVENNLINPLPMFDLPKFEINEEERQRVLLGQFIEIKQRHVMLNSFQHPIREQPCDPAHPTDGGTGSSGRRNTNFIILVYNNNVNAIAQVNGNLIKVKKVFE